MATRDVAVDLRTQGQETVERLLVVGVGAFGYMVTIPVCVIVCGFFPCVSEFQIFLYCR